MTENNPGSWTPTDREIAEITPLPEELHDLDGAIEVVAERAQRLGVALPSQVYDSLTEEGLLQLSGEMDPGTEEGDQVHVLQNAAYFESSGDSCSNEPQPPETVSDLLLETENPYEMVGGSTLSTEQKLRWLDLLDETMGHDTSDMTPDAKEKRLREFVEIGTLKSEIITEDVRTMQRLKQMLVSVMEEEFGAHDVNRTIASQIVTWARSTALGLHKPDEVRDLLIPQLDTQGADLDSAYLAYRFDNALSFYDRLLKDFMPPS